jgi:NOL1/NOP2/sun family putative RNA methylase
LSQISFNENSYAYQQSLKLLGENEISKLLTSFQAKQPSSIRINTLRYKPNEYFSRVSARGIELKPVPSIPEGFFVSSVPPESSDFWMRDRLFGYWYGQGSASMLPPKVLLPPDPNPDIFVLDATAAPGSKTTQMGAMMNNEGLIVANDKKSHRVYALHRNVQILGITNTVITQIDARYVGTRWPNNFDYVLLDGPCSATGSNRKHPFASREEQHYKAFQKYQKGILKSSLQTLRNKESHLVYSTCSLLPIENEFVLSPFIEKKEIELVPIDIPGWKVHPGRTEWDGKSLPAQLKNAIRIHPHDNNSDAFFIAKIKRIKN